MLPSRCTPGSHHSTLEWVHWTTHTIVQWWWISGWYNEWWPCSSHHFGELLDLSPGHCSCMFWRHQSVPPTSTHDVLGWYRRVDWFWRQTIQWIGGSTSPTILWDSEGGLRYRIQVYLCPERDPWWCSRREVDHPSRIWVRWHHAALSTTTNFHPYRVQLSSVDLQH